MTATTWVWYRAGKAWRCVIACRCHPFAGRIRLPEVNSFLCNETHLFTALPPFFPHSPETMFTENVPGRKCLFIVWREIPNFHWNLAFSITIWWYFCPYWLLGILFFQFLVNGELFCTHLFCNCLVATLNYLHNCFVNECVLLLADVGFQLFWWDWSLPNTWRKL
jgi:hypothetical protein